MAKIVSRDQIAEISARVMTQVNWDELDGDRIQREPIQFSPKEFGDRFTMFLKKGCRFNFGDPKSFLTKPFDPAKFNGLGQGWSVWKGAANGDGKSGEKDIDPRSLAIDEVNVSTMIFETCLVGLEISIKGETKLSRLKAKKDFVRFGANVFLGLWLDYQTNKENSVLEFLYRTKKIQYLDFFGTVLRSPHGDRGVLYLCRSDDGAWDWNAYWLDDGWDSSDLSAGRAS